MRIWLVLLLVGLAGTQVWASSFREEAEDNEFAEFEDFEDEDAAGASASHDRAPAQSPPSDQPKPSAPEPKPVIDEADEEEEADAMTEVTPYWKSNVLPNGYYFQHHLVSVISYLLRLLLQDEEDNEFEHFQDEEEFEGFDTERVVNNEKVDEKEVPKITITKVSL